MLVQQIDVIGTQAPQGFVHGIADAGGAAVGSGDFAILDLKPEFGGNDHLGALGPERTPEEFLVRVRAIDFGGIQKRAAQFDRTMQGRDGFRLVRRTIGLAHAHATQADRRYCQSLGAEFTGGQCHEVASMNGRAVDPAGR